MRLTGAGVALAACLVFASWAAPAGAGDGATGGFPSPPGFVWGPLSPAIAHPTSLAFGPDGRLYVASETSITALTIDPVTKQVTASETVASGLDFVLGLAFDPTAPSPVTVYASRQDPDATPGFQGTVSKFTAPTWQRQDVITGLPTSEPMLNHMTNGLAFDQTGRLFLAQGSQTDSGITNPPGDPAYWPETPLSAAILVAGIHAPGFNGSISYTPAGSPLDDNVNLAGGDVVVLASGLRNPYDLVIHSNGRIYATDNGPLGETYSAACSTSGSPSSPSDELNLIELGHYYGHPNRNRGRSDPRQCTYHPGEEASNAQYTAPMALLPRHCSCDGIAEYTSDALGGSLRGDLVYAEFGRNSVAIAHLSSDGTAVATTTRPVSDLRGPLDVAVAPDGTIYIAEYTGDRISYLAPDSDGDRCPDARELGPDETQGGRRNPQNPWDFYDVNGDGRITVSDILTVAAAFGPSSGPNYAPVKDRSPPPSAAQEPDPSRREPWDLGPPDGTINVIDDVFAVARQFGHTCS